MVANSHTSKNDNLINLLETRIVPMPEYMMEQILEGEDSISLKESIEGQIMFWGNESSNSYLRLIRHFRVDSLNTIADDSLINLLLARETPESFYDLASFYLSKGIYGLFENTMNQVPLTFPLSTLQYIFHQNYSDFFDIYNTIQEDSNLIFNLNNSRSTSLQNIYESNDYIPSIYARNLLIASGKINYDEPIILPDESLKSSKRYKYRGISSQNNSHILEIHPNPANEYFIIKYSLDKLFENGQIIIIDNLKRKLFSFPIKERQNQILLSATKIISGNYYVVLFGNGKVIDKIIFTIFH